MKRVSCTKMKAQLMINLLHFLTNEDNNVREYNFDFFFKYKTK